MTHMTRTHKTLFAVLIAVVGGVAAFALTRGGEQATNLTRFVDDERGIQLDYPDTWDALDSSDPQVLLVATPNGLDSLLVRAVELTVAIDDPIQLERAKEFTGELVTERTGVEIVAGPNPVSLAGLDGWFYLYRFTDEATGLTGVHSHYFLFRDTTMFVVVFQALPEASFEERAPTFDQIAESLQVSGITDQR